MLFDAAIGVVIGMLALLLVKAVQRLGARRSQPSGS
jgi:hypothetical protein